MDEKKLVPKVSVIVPMYNCGRFLEYFFQDMEAQSFPDFEMICVIDGATDNTLDIVRQYAGKDERIRYYYKENGGAGSARNYGFKYARGEYVMWIDVGDRYSPELLKEMVMAADTHMAEEVFCLCEVHDYLKNETRRNQGFSREDFPENTCVDPGDVSNIFQKVGTGPTNRIFRRIFIEENRLSFSNTRVANDIRFIFTAIVSAKKVAGVHKHLITVEKFLNPDSITSNRGKHSQEVFIALSELYQWLREKNLFEKYSQTYLAKFEGAFLYHAGFGVNPEFIEAAVQALNVEEPFAGMDPEAIDKLFGEDWDIGRIKNIIKKLDSDIHENGENLIPSARRNLEYWESHWKSRLEIFSKVKALSCIRYNRDFVEFKVTELTQRVTKLQRLYNGRVSELQKTKSELQSARLKLQKTKRSLQREKDSWNYKIGAAITWVPKKIYYLFKSTG